MCLKDRRAETPPSVERGSGGYTSIAIFAAECRAALIYTLERAPASRRGASNNMGRSISRAQKSRAREVSSQDSREVKVVSQA